jgi:mRNA-degrading endonuclease RelE of RelBE toxin-antitoxin system
MTVQIEFSGYFERELSRLNRKYPSVVDEVGILVEQLEQGDLPGDKVPDVGYDIYKVRLRNRSASRGKSGGFRVIYYIRRTDYIGMVSIYVKSEQTDIRPEKIRTLIKRYEDQQS